MSHLNINDPYMNKLRKGLMKYESNYSLNRPDEAEVSSINDYHPMALRGGNLHKIP